MAQIGALTLVGGGGFARGCGGGCVTASVAGCFGAFAAKYQMPPTVVANVSNIVMKSGVTVWKET